MWSRQWCGSALQCKTAVSGAVVCISTHPREPPSYRLMNSQLLNKHLRDSSPSLQRLRGGRPVHGIIYTENRGGGVNVGRSGSEVKGGFRNIRCLLRTRQVQRRWLVAVAVLQEQGPGAVKNRQFVFLPSQHPHTSHPRGRLCERECNGLGVGGWGGGSPVLCFISFNSLVIFTFQQRLLYLLLMESLDFLLFVFYVLTFFSRFS